ncbi:uroporphyrinogen-III synthase [Acinetobacter rathckeae]|uniref:uroporphyrinogen-III synthase n=1 Tax=Acinetobacter rathckeae TaxID=2605272 RepID=UPI0018A30038|nr:uroporphyrinogen-III synthase [Acinetobacter rathckeae]MBF7695132.1 uroporphyrinogen-III synthase [Acinetobacter rathckeae]
MLFINTRPPDRAKPLTQQLQQLGHEVLLLPLLELTPIALHATLIAQFERLNQADVVVVVSPTAAQIGIQYLSALNISLQMLPQCKWIAVGEKTAQVLAQAGIQADIPCVENSEGMLQLPVLQNPSMQIVAFWRGEGGRQFMMEELAAHGVEILNMLLYQRSLPNSSVVQAQVMCERLQDNGLNAVFVPMTSEASWKNWKRICVQHHVALSRFIYLPLGQRLTDMLHADLADKATSISPISDLKPATIHAVMLKGHTK